MRRPAAATRAIPALSAAALLALPAVARACPVCFGDPEAPATKGMQAAVLFLLGLTGLVLTGFASLFVFFWNRGRKVSADDSVVVQRTMEASKR